MYDPLSERFVPKEGAVVGYADQFWCKYHTKWCVQMAGIHFQTRSRHSRTEGTRQACERNRNFITEKNSTGASDGISETADYIFGTADRLS